MLFAVLDYSDVNLALNRPAYQPSTYSDNVASKAVDGSDGTHSCTEGFQIHPWISVDLGAEYDVGRVTVTNIYYAPTGNYRRIYNCFRQQEQQRSLPLWTRERAFHFCAPGVATCRFSVFLLTN